MSYTIRFTRTALEDLAQLNKQAQRKLLQRIEQAAGDPVRKSRPSAPPAERPGYQVFPFRLSDELEVKAFFRYADTKDEATIIIMFLGIIRYDTSP